MVVLINGRPLSTRWTAQHVPAVVEAWLPGEAGGTAVADVLFGDYNPTGKLPVTVPRHAGQLPLYYNSRPSRAEPKKGALDWRGYVDLLGSPLYPFGHGLSYTKFEYRNLAIAPKDTGPGGQIRVSLEVANAGNVTGAEVVQLYLRDVVSSFTRPVQELKGFRKIALAPGEKRQIEFVLKPEHLAMLNRALEPVVEPGAFEVMIGASSQDIRLRGGFEVKD